MKNSNETIDNRTRDLPTWSAVPQPTALPRAPSIGCNYHTFLHATPHRQIYCTIHGLNMDVIAVMSSEIFEFILCNYDLRKVLKLFHAYFAAILKPENQIILRMSHRKSSLWGTHHPVLETASTLRSEG
jgi:hypothetical protein